MTQLTLDPNKIESAVERIEGARAKIRETAFQVASGLPADLPPATADRLQIELSQILRAASASAAEIDNLVDELASVTTGFRRRGADAVDQHAPSSAGTPTQLLDFWTDHLATPESESVHAAGSSLGPLAVELLAAADDSAPKHQKSDTVDGSTAVIEEYAALDALGKGNWQLARSLDDLLGWLRVSADGLEHDLRAASTTLLDHVAEQEVRKFALESGQPGDSNDELHRHALERLANATDSILIVAPSVDGRHRLQTFLIDSGFGVFLTAENGIWSVSEPVAVDDVVWSIIDTVNSNADDTAALAHLAVLRSTLQSAVSTDIDGAPRTAEKLLFSGPLGAMSLMLGAGEGRSCSEQELFELLTVALGPAIDPPEWPTDPGRHAAVVKAPTDEPPAPASTGTLNRITLGACDSAAHDSSASGWQRALANPQIVAKLEAIDSSAPADERIVLSISSDNAVQWQTVDGNVSFEAFDHTAVSAQVERMLGSAFTDTAGQLPEALRSSMQRADLTEFVREQLEGAAEAKVPTVRRLSVAVAIKEADGLISGEELELIAIDHSGTFLVEPADDATVTLAPITAAALTDRLVEAALS